MNDFSIRPAQPRDLRALLDIYNYYVQETPITFDIEPRSLAHRQQWLDGFGTSGPYQCFVALKGEQVMGWASSHPYNERRAYETTVASSIYLRSDVVGQGIGRRLYGLLFDALEGEDIHCIFAGITLPNEASIRLHRAYDFELVGVMREIGRKFGRYWDVAIYVRPMSKRASLPP